MSNNKADTLRILVDSQRRATIDNPPPCSPTTTTTTTTAPQPPPHHTTVMKDLHTFLTELSTATTPTENTRPHPVPTHLLASLTTQLAHITTTVHDQAQAFQQAAHASNLEWHQKVTTLQHTLTATEATVQQLNERDATHRNENTTLALDVDKLTEQLNQHRQQASSSNTALTTVQQQQLERNKQLQLEYDTMKDNCDQEIQRLQLQITTSAQEKETIVNQNNQLQVQLDTTTTEVRVLQDRCDTAHQQHQALVSTNKQAHDDQVKQGQATVATMASALKETKDELNQALEQINRSNMSTNEQQRHLQELQDKHRNSEQGRIKAVDIQTKLRTSLGKKTKGGRCCVGFCFLLFYPSCLRPQPRHNAMATCCKPTRNA